MQEEKKINTKKFSFKRLFKRAFIGIIVLFVLLFSFLTVITQVPHFRQWTVAYVVDIVNEGLIGTIELEDINFLGIGGVKFVNARLIAGGDTLAFVPEITVNYSLKPFLDQKIAVHNLKLKNPRVKILRSLDSSWNVDKIAPPSTDTSTSSEPSPLWINVDELILENATVFFIDSLSMDTSLKEVDFSHMIFDSLNLTLGADVRPGYSRYKAMFRKFSFTERNTGFRLDNLSGDALIDTVQIKAENLKLKTDDVTININANLKNFTVFSKQGLVLDSVDFVSEIEAEGVTLEKVEYIVDLPINIGGKHAIKLKTHGTLNDLSVENLELESDNAKIDMSGKVKNLLRTDYFSYDMNIDNSTISSHDLDRIIPEYKLGKLLHFNDMFLKKMHAKGNIAEVQTSIDLTSSVGNVSGDIHFHFLDSLELSAKLNYKYLNLGELLSNKTIESSLSGNVETQLEGKSFLEMLGYFKVDSYKSHMFDIAYESLKLRADVKQNSIIYIDTLNIGFRNQLDSIEIETNYGSMYSRVFINGNIDYSELMNPRYYLDVKTKDVDFAYMLKNPVLPQSIDANINLNGEGFNIDSLQSSIDIQVSKCLFTNQYLRPFQINTDAGFNKNGKRMFKMHSDFVDVDIDGDFIFADLIDEIKLQGKYINDFVDHQIQKVVPDSNFSFIDTTHIVEKVNSFKPINVELHANIKDISILNALVPGMSINTEAFLAFKFKTSKNKSLFKLDTLNVETFDFSMNDINFRSEDIYMNSKLGINLIDSMPKFDVFDLQLDNKTNITFNELAFNNNSIALDFDGKKVEFDLQTSINEQLGIKTIGLIEIGDGNINFTFNSLQTSLNSEMEWKNPKPLNILFTGKGFEVNSFKLVRKAKESIELKGSLINNIAKDLKLSVQGFPLNDITQFFPENLETMFSSLTGNIKNLEIDINKKITSPRVVMELMIDDVSLNDYVVGDYQANFQFERNNLSGFSHIFTDKLGKSIDVVNLDVLSMPIELFKIDNPIDKGIDIKVRAERFPIRSISMLIPNVSEAEGVANASLSIFGPTFDQMEYKGSAKVLKAKLRIDNTNVKYFAQGDFGISTDLVTLEKVTIQNMLKEKISGSAVVKGTATLKDFLPHVLDLKVRASNLLVMNKSTVKSMPDMYGNFVISTGTNPLHFYGTLLKPNLEGDVDVVYGDLKMPEAKQGKVQYSKLIYKLNEDDTIEFRYTDPKLKDTTKTKVESGFKKGGSIADLMNYDLNIRILKNITLHMDIGMFIQLFADVRTEDKNKPIRFIKKRNTQQAKLIGKLLVNKSSSLKTVKIFKTYGEISFPTAELQNPSLNLTAEYEGVMSDSEVQKTYLVKILITGTKSNPKVEFSYSISGEEATGDKKKVEENAMYLLLTGNLKGASSQNNSRSEFGNIGTLGSGVASKVLTDILMKTGFVQSADLDVNSDRINESKFKVSGEVFGLNYQWGSTIGNLGNNEIIVTVPIAKLFNSSSTNISAQIMVAPNASRELNQLQEPKRFEIKLRLGGSK